MKLAIAFAKFDLEEGPQIQQLIPKNFPLDSQQEFEISNYALFASGFFSFERDDLFVVGYSFETDSGHPRSPTTKAAVMLIIKGANKREKQKLLKIAEEHLRQLAEKTRKSRLEDVLKEAFDEIKREMASSPLRDRPQVEGVATHKDGLGTAIIVDSMLKLAILVGCENFEECLNTIRAYGFTKNGRFLVLANEEKFAERLLHYLEKVEMEGKLPSRSELIRYQSS